MDELECKVAALERVVQELTARVEALESEKRPNVMPLGDLMAERFRNPGEAVSANPSRTPSHGTGEAD